GHLRGAPVDILRYGDDSMRFETERVDTRNTHGTGCTTAAALAALLARGFPLPAAAQLAKEFIHIAITTALDIGHGHGPVNHFIAADSLKLRLQLQHERTEQ
ncbi:MAG: bifunctional hydroxymethylpyrimidine kinase/phosphomethylpyrimidine kinase, partial [Geobacteraceae bacterium]|nr:bifunctional hydroxymethylpyrimidine kinase/phosphomethylpyrimidine kinase [Geobacteraceae bacterium]